MMTQKSAEEALDWATSMADEAAGTKYEDACEALVLALKTIAAKPQIIRTESELGALGPEAFVVGRNGRLDQVMDWFGPYGEPDERSVQHLPAVVIASHESAKAALRALAEEV